MSLHRLLLLSFFTLALSGTVVMAETAPYTDPDVKPLFPIVTWIDRHTNGQPTETLEREFKREFGWPQRELVRTSQSAYNSADKRFKFLCDVIRRDGHTMLLFTFKKIGVDHTFWLYDDNGVHLMTLYYTVSSHTLRLVTPSADQLSLGRRTRDFFLKKAQEDAPVSK